MVTTFSLVIATYGRVETLDRLFSSIAAQAEILVECILVDQNADDRLLPILERWLPHIVIKVIHASPQLSRARNLGIESATGKIIAFPDDDCWYPPGLFAKVSNFFETHPEYDMLSTGVRDDQQVLSGNRWVQRTCDIAPVNVFRTSVTFGLFLRRDARLAGIRFDEEIGPNSNTMFGCGEDTDYVLTAVSAGARGYFDQELTVHHPRKDMLSGNVSADRAISYGRGMGHVIRKHDLPLLWVSFLTYDLARALACAIRGDRLAAALCLAHARGVREGYLATAPSSRARS